MCRQWAQLVHSPSLLRCLSVSVAVRGDFFVGLPHEAAVAQMADLQRKQRRFMERLRSLCVWLVQRAAGHVQQLELCLTAPDLRQADRAADHLEAAGMLAAALAAQASTLERLHLATHCLVLPTLGVWLAPLTRLTHLFLSSGSEELAIRGPLHLAHSLQSLHLGGLPVLEPTVELPLGLTRLSMYFGSSEHPLPAQVGSPVPHCHSTPFGHAGGCAAGRHSAL